MRVRRYKCINCGTQTSQGVLLCEVCDPPAPRKKSFVPRRGSALNKFGWFMFWVMLLGFTIYWLTK